MTVRSRHHGYALVLVLWTVTLLAALTLRYQAAARVESKLIVQSLRTIQAREAAETGLWLAVADTLSSPEGPPSGMVPIERTFITSDVQVTVRISDLAGRINVNRAPRDLLRAALTSAGVNETALDIATEAILNRRNADPESTKRDGQLGNGSTNAIPPVKHGLFSTVDELLRIQGITSSNLETLQGIVTVFGTHRRVNLDAAPAAVLLTLPGASRESVNGFVTARAAPRTGNRAALSGINRRFVQHAGSDLFLVQAKATVGGVTVKLSPVIRMPRRGNGAVSVLRWDDA